ncbi:MAG: T9SS C-terminal target domain-containing protein, partial [Bacteroidetes bacterium]
SLTPSLGWAGIGTDTLSVNADGSVTPASYALGSYLYGSQWNTQFRSPPVFVVDYPADGTFTVRTGSSTSTSPKITIRLDGVIVLNQNAQINTSYTLNVPAGPHHIRVDNSGADWVSIASYRFSGLGSKIDAYILKAADGKSAAGWLLSNQYNHEVLPVSGVPAAVTGAQLTLSGLEDSTYFLKWYNCLTGALLSGSAVNVSGGALTVPIPTVIWDLAFVLERPGTIASVAAPRPDMAFQLYPNPVAAGGVLTIEIPGNQRLPATATLLDRGGRWVQEWSVDASSPFRLALPADLAKGFYWLMVNDGEKVGAKPLIVE